MIPDKELVEQSEGATGLGQGQSEFGILSYLQLSIIAFVDLLQSPFQPRQFRLPLPLHPANGLRHPRFLPLPNRSLTGHQQPITVH